MQKNTTIIVVLITLGIGLSIGYGMATNKALTSVTTQQSNGGHMMSDGTMMGGSGGMNMQDSMMSMNAGLKGKTGDAFDQAFLVDMIIHHQGAVEMAQTALVNAKRQEIKNLATEIISAQNKEIAEMKAWQTSWYGQQ